MATYFVTRHAGAVAWAEEEGFKVDHWITHFDPSTVKPGDIVLGSLPVHLAAQVIDRGGRYFHLGLNLGPDDRGRELTATDMRRCGARLEEYEVKRVRAAD